jgi:hypothetical protein
MSDTANSEMQRLLDLVAEMSRRETETLAILHSCGICKRTGIVEAAQQVKESLDWWRGEG